MEAEATGPNEVTVTFTLTAKEAENLGVGFKAPNVDTDAVLDAAEDAREWELEKHKSEARRKQEQRAERAQEWDHGGANW